MVKQTDILRLKMKINDFASAIFGALHGWLMFGEKTLYEDGLTFEKGKLVFKEQKPSNMSTILRIVCLLITAALVFTIVKHYQFKFRMRKIENYDYYYPSIWRDPSMRLMFIIELILCSVLMPPVLNLVVGGDVGGGSVSYTLDMVISSICLLKSYTLLRVYEHVSSWTNFTAKKIAFQFGLETDYKFAFKSDVRSNNVWLYLCFAVVTVFYLGTLIFNFER